jgi:hypothetical protein
MPNLASQFKTFSWHQFKSFNAFSVKASRLNCRYTYSEGHWAFFRSMAPERNEGRNNTTPTQAFGRWGCCSCASALRHGAYQSKTLEEGVREAEVSGLQLLPTLQASFQKGLNLRTELYEQKRIDSGR